MSNTIPQGKIVNPLTSEEKTAITERVELTIKNYRIGFILACISIIIVIGIFIAPAMYVALLKEQKKLADLQHTDLKVYELSGVLSRKNVGYKGNLYAYMIDDQMIPGEISSDNDKSGIKERLGKPVSFQYIPSISKNRLYQDENGKGYNFITKLPLSA